MTCGASPATLFPHNRKLVDVAAHVEVTDEDSGPAGFALVSVASSQPDSGTGGGDRPATSRAGRPAPTTRRGACAPELSRRATRVYMPPTFRGFDRAGKPPPAPPTSRSCAAGRLACSVVGLTSPRDPGARARGPVNLSGMSASTSSTPAIRPHDFLDLDALLTTRSATSATRCARSSRQGGAARRRLVRGGDVPRELAPELGKLGVLGMHLEGYGCAGASATAYGLACMELEAGDSGVRCLVSVQGSLAMYAIHRWGARSRSRSGCRGWPRARRSAASD